MPIFLNSVFYFGSHPKSLFSSGYQESVWLLAIKIQQSIQYYSPLSKTLISHSLPKSHHHLLPKASLSLTSIELFQFGTHLGINVIWQHFVNKDVHANVILSCILIQYFSTLSPITLPPTQLYHIAWCRM